MTRQRNFPELPTPRPFDAPPVSLWREWREIHAIGNIDDRLRIRTQSQQAFSSESANGDQSVGRLQPLNIPLDQHGPTQSDVAFADIAAVTGDDRGHTEGISTKRGQVAGRIHAMTVQHIESMTAMTAPQPKGIPLHQPARGNEPRMAFDTIGELGVVDPPRRPGARGEHDNLMAQGCELPGECVHHELLPAHLGQGGLGVEANPHALTSLAPFEFNGRFTFRVHRMVRIASCSGRNVNDSAIKPGSI